MITDAHFTQNPDGSWRATTYARSASLEPAHAGDPPVLVELGTYGPFDNLWEACSVVVGLPEGEKT